MHPMLSLVHRACRQAVRARALSRLVACAAILLVGLTPLAAQGLYGEYFDGTDLTGFADSRIDPTIDFTGWGGAPTGTAVQPDDAFSERWTGVVRIDTAGSWTFKTVSNDGVRLWIDDTLLIDNWTQHAATVDTASVSLPAGWSTIRLEHFQDGGSVVIQLLFSGPGQPEVIVPPTHLAVQAGLLGEYYDEPDLTDLADTRVDPNIDFTGWGSAPTGTDVQPDDEYSERWTGYVFVDETGLWRFGTLSNDGVRLWVDDVLIIDHWTQHATTTDVGALPLAEGWYLIRLEHFQQGGGVDIQLSFSPPSGSMHVIPPTHLALVPGAGVVPPLVDAGAQVQVLQPENTASLSVSIEDDGEIASIAWQQIDGHPVVMGPTNQQTLLLAGLNAVGSYRFRVTVIDDSGLSAFDDVELLVVDPNHGAGTVRGTTRTWHRISIDFEGPASSEQDALNPFTDLRADVTFRHVTSGATVTVPAFFAADGEAHDTGATAGDIWRAHFVADRPGTWTYSLSVRQGNNVAASLDPMAGAPATGNGQAGSVFVAESFLLGEGLARGGRISYVDDTYLRMAGSNRPWLKAGANSPENLLAFGDFDQTTGSHAYAPHIADWSPSDPVWRGDKGKGLLGALNYLASKGMNVVYFLTFNVDGDGDDVWPWTSKSERLRYDVSKLDQWELVFQHMEALGLAAHFVLQETENGEGSVALDGGDLGLERKIYFRELVARFGHHLGVIWNLGEETTNSTAQLVDYHDHLRALDAFDNQIVVHTFPGQKAQVWDPLLDQQLLEGASLQNSSIFDTHAVTLDWRQESIDEGKPWAVMLDEHGPFNLGALPDAADPAHDGERIHGTWGNLMAGGSGVEWYFGYDFPHDDLDCEDWRSRDLLWDMTRYALDFFEQHLAFTDMEPRDDLVSGGDAWCLANEGIAYAVYLPDGDTVSLDLGTITETFHVRWYDPQAGGELLTSGVTTVSGPGSVSLGAPPFGANRDWAVRVKRTNNAPVVVQAGVNPSTFTGGDLTVNIRVGDLDGLAEIATVAVYYFAPDLTFLFALPATPVFGTNDLWSLTLNDLPPLPSGTWPVGVQVIDIEGDNGVLLTNFVAP